jgi:hypothetical protein
LNDELSRQLTLHEGALSGKRIIGKKISHVEGENERAGQKHDYHLWTKLKKECLVRSSIDDKRRSFFNGCHRNVTLLGGEKRPICLIVV